MTPTIVTRTLASIPQVVATVTWRRIVELIAPHVTSPARAELNAVAGVACSCITDEALREDALTVFGVGPRVRFYCLYGDDAVEGDAVNDSPLTFIPTNGDWNMSIPCLEEDLAWAQSAVAKVSSRVTLRAVGTEIEDEKSTKTQSANAFNVDLSAYHRN